MRVFLLIAITGLLASSYAAELVLPTASASGGATTVQDDSSNAFSLPAANTSLLRRDDFFIGNAFFQQPWVIAPSSTSARDGLGPLFNANSCQSCHIKDGRGHPPLDQDEPLLSALIRLSIPAKNAEQTQTLQTLGVIPEPTYGDQWQPRGIKGLAGEGSIQIIYDTLQGQFNDGETYTLLKPKLIVDRLNYGNLTEQVQFSLRIAPPMIGLGLLEAIPEATILHNADPDDTDKNGISGRANYVWDIKAQKTVLGRFGWKANQPTIVQQSAAAFNSDMGITSTLFPENNCTLKQTDCNQLPNGGTPEISDEILSKVVFYASLLAVPARRITQDALVLQGQQLFTRSGCAQCHLSEVKTGTKAGFPELSEQTIQPFTDLLLHDMGEGLADHRPDFLASGSEWRTPPLWGIGLTERVSGHTRFLHDGRARNLLEAILWHGGEAQPAQQAVIALSKAERTALIRFLESL